MRHLTPADYRIMPWKNGGGTTTEIAIYPEGSGISDQPFIWRLSIADVATDGPFSRFPGYDRHIMTISGAGMRLDAGDHGEFDLSTPFVPQSFSGDWDVTGHLTAGPVRDFNLMAARARVASVLRVESLDKGRKFSGGEGTTIIYLIDGEALAEGHLAASGDTLILDKVEAVSLSPLGTAALLAVATIHPRGEHPAS